MRQSYYNSVKKYIGGIIVVVIFSFTLSLAHIAQGDSSLLDDCEHGTNENHFHGYWYVYDDSKMTRADDADFMSEDYTLLGGNSLITNQIKDTVTLDYKAFIMTEGEGCTEPGGTPGYGAKMAFQMGDIHPEWQTGSTYPGYVGMGTELIYNNGMLDLTGATHVTYWAKASEELVIQNEIGSAQQPMFHFSAFFYTEHTFTTSWQQFTTYLAEGVLGAWMLQQPSWAGSKSVDINLDATPWMPVVGADVSPITDFDLKFLTKLQWKVSQQSNTQLQRSQGDGIGSIWIDDIHIHGYKWYPWEACLECVRDAGELNASYGSLISDVTTNENELGYYWYAYNDAAKRPEVTIPIDEYSAITSGATTPEGSTTPLIEITTGAADIQFTLGPRYREEDPMTGDTNWIKPFVGVGTSLGADDGSDYYDGTDIKGFYFHYLTEGDGVEYIRVEIKTSIEYPNEGLVYYMLLPATGGEWKEALVPIDAFDLPKWAIVDMLSEDMKVLKMDELLKIQWGFQGEPGTSGRLAIDNVWMVTSEEPFIPISYFPSYNSTNGGFYIKQFNNNISFTLPTALKKASVQLLTIDGKEIINHSVIANRDAIYTLPINTNSLASGLYIVTVKGTDLNKLLFTKALTIMK